MLESKYGSPRIVNDGVTVAKEVELEDPVENIGAKLVRQVHRLHASHQQQPYHPQLSGFPVGPPVDSKLLLYGMQNGPPRRSTYLTCSI